jgi:hypothetical protein
MVVKVEKKIDFEGEATAELLGLPANTTTEPLKFTKDSTELVFKDQDRRQTARPACTRRWSAGRWCQDGEPVTHTLGTGELRIDEPLPPKPARRNPQPQSRPSKPPQRPISFQLDVMPVFMRPAATRAAATARPAARTASAVAVRLRSARRLLPHHARNRHGRRINLALPGESLLIEKSIGAVPHTGGKRFDADSEYYQTRCCAGSKPGAPLGPGEPPHVVDAWISIRPRPCSKAKGRRSSSSPAPATADGTDRDVTDLAVFMTSNDNSAPVNPDGLVTAAARGEAFVMARFETHTVGSQVLVLPKDLQYTPPADHRQLHRRWSAPS